MIVLTVILCGCLACAALWQRGRRERIRLRVALDEAEAGRQSLQRLARLAGRDLRDVALRLQGQADAMAGPTTAAATLAAHAERCRILAEDLGAAGLPLTVASLREDRFDLLDCVREAVAAVSATIAPGRRHFLLPAAATHAGLWADLRAVRQVVGRVLAEAVFSTRQNDSISVLLEEENGALVLAVADEGLGLLGQDAAGIDGPSFSRDSRGLVATLALSRALMEVHGGRLEVLAAPAAGTRVSLVFPRDRRR